MLKTLILSFSLLFTACNLASNGHTYRSMTFEEDDTLYVYSCEENFSDINISTRLEKSHKYLFSAIHSESEKLVNDIFDEIYETNTTDKKDLSLTQWWGFFKQSYTLQSNLKKKMDEIDSKFGCRYQSPE